MVDFAVIFSDVFTVFSSSLVLLETLKTAVNYINTHVGVCSIEFYRPHTVANDDDHAIFVL